MIYHDEDYTITLPRPHDNQDKFIDDPAKRKIIRAGRRSGKTVGVGIYAVRRFLAGRRILYGVPTAEQVDRFWMTVTRALAEPIEAGVLYKNETRHIIEVKGTERRIRAKTAWNADTLRGDYADELILDEFQLMREDAWELVGAPMLIDNNGNAILVYTPPSLESRSKSKARNPRYASKLFKMAQDDAAGRWAAFHFTSYDNPHVSRVAIDEMSLDMTRTGFRMEIMAEDLDEAPGALWKRQDIDRHRATSTPELMTVVVGVDPATTSAGDEAGIVVAGNTQDIHPHIYVLADQTLQGSPRRWATEAVTAYHLHNADVIVAESNQGGEMVAETIHQIDKGVPVKLVHASRGKQPRAHPISAIYEKGRGHHVGVFEELEDEMCLWVPGDASPNRMDALVWAASYLLGIGGISPEGLIVGI